MASTVVDDKSAALADESDAAVAATVTTASCLNDPNYAIICVFLEKFGAHLKIQHPDFLKLQKMIENTDEGRSAVYAFLALPPYTHTHTHNSAFTHMATVSMLQRTNVARATHTRAHTPRTVSVHFVFVVGLARSAPHKHTHAHTCE